MRTKKLLGLNEKELYKEYSNNCRCNYPGCECKAINSHTYPQSYLRKFASSNFLYATDIESIVSTMFFKSYNVDFVNKVSVKRAGAKPLFCSKHDSDIFRVIESDEEVDLDNYLLLFLYRVFIYDYVLEKAVKVPSVQTQILKDKDYAKKLSEQDEDSYLFISNEIKKILDKDYSFRSYELLKVKLDRVITQRLENRINSLREEFVLKYFKINKKLDFAASGTMHFKASQVNTISNNPIPSIYALVPDKKNDCAYFTILFTLEEKENMDVLISRLEKEYEEYITGINDVFIKDMEFVLLDASQNVLINEILYEKLKEDHKLENLKKVYHLLNYARNKLIIDSDRIKLRDEAYELLKGIEIV